MKTEGAAVCVLLLSFVLQIKPKKLRIFVLYNNLLFLFTFAWIHAKILLV